ncbi:glycosyltransferase [Roseivirga sp.]|uniref:glycosyltransferase n=1 Tax=Roseivirga sp. TaxID=1964215 RepID=UPI002B2757C9|nr:glycosyltransferase [Roseivirga sp.]
MAKKRVFSVVFNDLRNDNRVLNQAFSLASEGYDVTLMGIQRKTSLPTEEQLNGVKIIRKRMMNNTIERIKYVRAVYFILFVWLQFFRQARVKYDIIHCHDLNTLQFGVLMKFIKLGKVKLIYDAHEYETQRNGLHGLKWTYVKLKERLLIRFCDRVITVGPTIADEYVRLYGIEKPVVILNCPILRSEEVIKKNLFREQFGIPASKKIFLYQGYLYPGRGIEVILEAFDQLNLADGVLVFMGEGTLTDEIKKHKKYGESVFVHPFVLGDVLLGYTSSADCGIAFIEDISLSDRYCLPNKLFEYIAAGLPVISSGLPDLKKFINTYKVGTAADSNNVEGFIQAFNNLPNLDSPELARHILNTRALFNWGTQEKILFELYKSFEDKNQL